MATLGLDTSEYEQGVSDVQKSTKSTVAQLSTEYSKVAQNVAELTRKYNESAQKTGKNSTETKELKSQLSAAEAQLKTTATALKAANNGMDSFGQKTEEAASKQKKLTESLAGSIAKAQALTTVVMSLGSKIISVAEKVTSAGVDYNKQLETYRTGLTNMLGDAEAANTALENMKQDAARTPFDTESIVKANQYLIGAGENAAYARKTILALGDAVSATGGGSDELNRMAQNLQQIANVGKASSVDIKQFAFAGINIYQVLADYTGKSVQDVQSMTVTYDVLTKALQAAAEEGGRYYNSMTTQSETLTGRLSTLKDNATQLAGVLTEKLASAYGDLVSKANDLAIAMKEGWETDGFEGMMDAAAETIPQLEGVANATVWLKENGSKLLPVLTTLTGSFVAMKLAAGAAGALGAITSLMNPLGLLAGLFITAYTQSESFRDIVNGAFESVWSFCGPIFNRLLDGLAKVQNWFNHAATAARNFWNAQKGGGSTTDDDGFGGSNGGSFGTGDMGGGKAGGGAGRLKKTDTDVKPETVDTSIPKKPGSSSSGSTTTESDNAKTITESVISSQTDAATSYALNQFGRVTTATSELTEKILKSDGSSYDRFTKTVTESGKELVNGVVKNYKTITKTVKGENGEVTSTTQKTYEDAAQTLTSTLTRTSQTLVNGISTTVNTVTQLYADGSSELVTTTTETGKRLVNGVLETYTKVKKIAEDGTETVNETVEQLKFSDFIKSSNSAISDFGSKITALGEYFDSDLIQNVGDFFTEITDGVEKVLDLATSTATLVTTLQELKTTLNSVKAAGGVSGTISGIGKLLGVGGATAAAGTAAGTTAAGTGLAALGLSIPQLGLIVAGVLGVSAVGYGIYKWATKNKTKDTTASSNKLSYTDLQDAYWYGNERAFAGYDYRTDPYTFGTAQSPMKAYQDKMQSLVETMTDYVEQYLPQAGNNSIVLDDGTLVGRMAPQMNAEMGQLAVLSGRGN